MKTMKHFVEPMLLGVTGIFLLLYLFNITPAGIPFSVCLIVLGAYYLGISINGAIKGTLDPVFHKEVTVVSEARRIYLFSGLTIALACVTLFMRFAEDYYALFLPIVTIGLLFFSLWSIDGLFHKTSDRRHLPMLYRLGFFSAVVLISYLV